jgi:hypothetical protein
LMRPVAGPGFWTAAAVLTRLRRIEAGSIPEYSRPALAGKTLKGAEFVPETEQGEVSETP